MTNGRQTPPDTPGALDCAYNLFRNREFPEIICAVPEDRPIPSFITPEQWIFDHPVRPPETQPLGFQGKAAKTAVRFNGYYLFYALASAPAVQAALDMLTGGL